MEPNPKTASPTTAQLGDYMPSSYVTDSDAMYAETRRFELDSTRQESPMPPRPSHPQQPPPFNHETFPSLSPDPARQQSLLEAAESRINDRKEAPIIEIPRGHHTPTLSEQHNDLQRLTSSVQSLHDLFANVASYMKNQHDTNIEHQRRLDKTDATQQDHENRLLALEEALHAASGSRNACPPQPDIQSRYAPLERT